MVLLSVKEPSTPMFSCSLKRALFLESALTPCQNTGQKHSVRLWALRPRNIAQRQSSQLGCRKCPEQQTLISASSIPKLPFSKPRAGVAMTPGSRLRRHLLGGAGSRAFHDGDSDQRPPRRRRRRRRARLGRDRRTRSRAPRLSPTPRSPPVLAAARHGRFSLPGGRGAPPAPIAASGDRVDGRSPPFFALRDH